MTSCKETAQSGEKSVEYRKVQANLVSITKTLKANKGAAETLHQTLKQERWVGLDDKSSPSELMDIVLDSIRRNVTEYSKFMTILDNITGLDETRKIIEKTKLPVEETHRSYRVDSSSLDGSYAVAHDNEVEIRHPSGTSKGSSQKEVRHNDATDSGQESDAGTKSVTKQKSPGQTKSATQLSHEKMQEGDPESGIMPFHASSDNAEPIPADDLKGSDTQSAQAHFHNTTSTLITGAGHQSIEKLTKLGQPIKQAENELSRLEEELRIVREEVAHLKTELELKNTKLRDYENDLEQYKQNNAELQAKIEAERADKEEVEKSLQEVKTKLTLLESEEKKTKEEIADLQDQMSQVKLKHKEDIEALRQEFDKKLKVICVEQLREQLRKAEEREKKQMDMIQTLIEKQK